MLVCHLPQQESGLPDSKNLPRGTILLAQEQWLPRPSGRCHQSPTSAHHSRDPQSQSLHSSPEGAAAITISMLKHLCRAVPKLGLNGNNATMFQAAMSFAFFGCLRISELAFSESTGRRNANPQLRDISVSSSSLIYHLWQSKTD